MPDAVGPRGREPTVRGRLAELDSQVVPELMCHSILSGHGTTGRAAQANDEAPVAFLVEESVEGRHTIEFDAMNSQRLGNHLHGKIADGMMAFLHGLKNGDQCAAAVSVLVRQRDYVSCHSFLLGHEHQDSLLFSDSA
jgi:hypothetical protein